MVHKEPTETEEFFVPRLGLDVATYIKANNKQGIHHIGRYQWACLALADRRPSRLIDIACGAGYGSFMIATALPETRVLGIDYDVRAIQHAEKHYQAPNLSFQVGNFTTWASGGEPLGQCDMITSFDTIEHLNHREVALMRLCDNLVSDGWLLLSTPCGHLETLLNPAWEHHKCEYGARDLFGLLSRFFERVIQPQDAEFVAYDFWQQQINADTRRYLNRMNPVICKNPICPPPYRPGI